MKLASLSTKSMIRKQSTQIRQL